MKYNFQLLLILLIIITFNGCIKRTDFKKELEVLNSYSKNVIDHELELKNDLDLLENKQTFSLEKLTLNNTIGIALKNNAFLQASFEDLGVAKSDVEYAGLYGTNPHLETVLKFPNKKTAKTILELEGSLPISNYWQVPFKRKVFKDELIIVTWGIASLILDTIKDVKTTYAECFFESEIIKKYEKIIQISLQLIKRTKLRKNYGLETTKSIYMTQEKYQHFLLDQKKRINNLNNNILNLKRLMGINLTKNQISLETNLKEVSYLNLNEDFLIDFMEKCNPDIYLANQMISKYTNILKLEQSRFIKEFNLGFSYKREDDGLKTFGPLLSMDIPLFDTNRGEIEKSKFLIQKLKKSYISQKDKIKQDLLTSFNNFKYFSHLESTYTSSLIPLKNKIKNFTLKYFKKMQLTKTEYLEAKLDFYLAEIEWLNSQKETFIAFANIERNTGKNFLIL